MKGSLCNLHSGEPEEVGSCCRGHWVSNAFRISSTWNASFVFLVRLLCMFSWMSLQVYQNYPVSASIFCIPKNLCLWHVWRMFETFKEKWGRCDPLTVIGNFPFKSIFMSSEFCMAWLLYLDVSFLPKWFLFIYLFWGCDSCPMLALCSPVKSHLIPKLLAASHSLWTSPCAT